MIQLKNKITTPDEVFVILGRVMGNGISLKEKKKMICLV